MRPAGALLKCRTCGEERLIQVHIEVKRYTDTGAEVDVQVDDREVDLVVRFYQLHLEPTAMAMG